MSFREYFELRGDDFLSFFILCLMEYVSTMVFESLISWTFLSQSY